MEVQEEAAQRVFGLALHFFFLIFVGCGKV